MKDAAIVAEGLAKRFGEVRALDGVDLELRPGGILGLLGPNGAGKTTIVRILATLLPPDSGRARVAGLDVVTQAAEVRRMIGLSGQFAAVDSYLTGRENLRLIGRLCGLSRAAARSRTDELLERLDLTAAAARRPERTPAGCGAASTSPRAWSDGRRCCSSTSRPPASTPAAAWPCGSCSAT